MLSFYYFEQSNHIRIHRKVYPKCQSYPNKSGLPPNGDTLVSCMYYDSQNGSAAPLRSITITEGVISRVEGIVSNEVVLARLLRENCRLGDRFAEELLWLEEPAID